MAFHLERPENRRPESIPGYCGGKPYNGDCNGRNVMSTASLFGSVHPTQRPCRIPGLANQSGMSKSLKLIQNKRNCSDSSPLTLAPKQRSKAHGSERDARVKMLISLYNRSLTPSAQSLSAQIEKERYSQEPHWHSSQATSSHNIKQSHVYNKKITSQPHSVKKQCIPSVFADPPHSLCRSKKSDFEVNFLGYSKNHTLKSKNAHHMQRRDCLANQDQNDRSTFRGILKPPHSISQISCQLPHYQPNIFPKGNQNRNTYDNRFNHAGRPVCNTNTNESSYLGTWETNQFQRSDLMKGIEMNTYKSGPTPQQSDIKHTPRISKIVKTSQNPLKYTKEDIIIGSKYPSGSGKTASLNASIRSNEKLLMKSELEVLNEPTFLKFITPEGQCQRAPLNSTKKPTIPAAPKKCNSHFNSNYHNALPISHVAGDSKFLMHTPQQLKRNTSKEFPSPLQSSRRRYTASQLKQPATVPSFVENHSKLLGRKLSSRLTFNERINDWGHKTPAHISMEDEICQTLDACRNMHKVINQKRMKDNEIKGTSNDNNMRRGREGPERCSNITSSEGTTRRRSPTLTRSDSSIENETSPMPIPQSWVSRVVGYFERITGSANSPNLNVEDPKTGSSFADEDSKIWWGKVPYQTGNTVDTQTDEAHVDTKGHVSNHEWREQRTNRPKLQRSYSLPRQTTRGLRGHQNSRVRASKSSFDSHPHDLLRSAACKRHTSYESLLAFNSELESDKKFSLEVNDQEKDKCSANERQSNYNNLPADRCKGCTSEINETTKTLEVDDTVYRTKNCSSDSCHSDSKPHLLNYSSKSFRHAIYGSIYGNEGHYMTSDYIMSFTDGSDTSPNASENSDTSSSLSTIPCKLHTINSSDEFFDYDSGCAKENEGNEQKIDQKVHSCPKIMELVSNKEKRWCQIPEIANSEFFYNLTSNQRKIQEAKFEVITSETTYMRQLNVLISHFIESDTLKDEQILSKEDRGKLFSNIIAVKNCSEIFLADLELSWQNDFSLQDLDEVIYKNAEKNFGVYITYCRNQSQQICTLNKLMELELFARAIDDLESHPICHRRTLQCYLIMPMQRVTRIRLLIDTILARLPHENPKHRGWKLACDALNKVVKQCNEAAKQAALMEEKKILSEKLNFRRVEQVNLDSRERYLLHWGEVKHLYTSNDSASHSGALSTPSNNIGYRKLIKQPFTFGRKLIKQPLYLLLFTDLVIITKKKSDDKFMVLDCSPRHMVDVLNGDPSSLHELSQKNYTEEWRNIFHLFIRKDGEKGWVEMT